MGEFDYAVSKNIAYVCLDWIDKYYFLMEKGGEL
jgi:hypothetical protein